MNKLLEILSKLGILKYGGTAGTYRNEAAPSEFEYMNKNRKERDKIAGSEQKIPDNSKGNVAESDTPLWAIIATWVLGTLFWVLALGAFAEGKSLIGFWMVLAGLVTVHHTNKLLALVGIELTLLWRVIVVVVCLLVLIVTI